jgi:hypothetical protein
MQTNHAKITDFMQNMGLRSLVKAVEILRALELNT